MNLEKSKLKMSTRYRHWVSRIDPKRCLRCEKKHGKIYAADEMIREKPPLHPYCRCVIKAMSAIMAGRATEKGKNGADWWLKYQGKLPNYYITETEAKKIGFHPKGGNLAQVAPGKILTKGEYSNKNGHLPSVPERIWYEADINYTQGYRGRERVLFSNDGLIFVTYDHYHTFYEII